MTTLAQVCKTIVTDAIDHDYLADCEATLREVYYSEYGSGRMYYHPTTCMGYLQGLPSVCTVPFSNFEILELLEKAGIEIGVEEDYIDGQYELIEKYWAECGKQFYLMLVE